MAIQLESKTFTHADVNDDALTGPHPIEGTKRSLARTTVAFLAVAAPNLAGPASAAEQWSAASGDSYMPDSHDKFSYRLPEGKSPKDIVAIAIASNNHVYAWYKDGSVTSGTSTDLAAHRKKPYVYRMQKGKAPNNIVAIAIAKSNDRVYAWYDSGSVSSGTTEDLASVRTHTLQLYAAAGKNPRGHCRDAHCTRRPRVRTVQGWDRVLGHNRSPRPLSPALEDDSEGLPTARGVARAKNGGHGYRPNKQPSL